MELPGSSSYERSDAPDPVGRGLLDVLPDESVREVRAAMRRRNFRKGEVIFHDGDPGETLHLIEKGHVAIRRSTPLGDTVTFTILRAGDTFGELALLRADSARAASAIALEPTTTLSLGRATLDELRSRGPAVDRFIQAALAAQVESLSARLLEALYCGADKRILRRLVDLADLYGRGDGDGDRRIPITQEDLASLAGTTRPTVNRLLKALEADGLLSVGRGSVTVHDLATIVRKSR